MYKFKIHLINSLIIASFILFNCLNLAAEENGSRLPEKGCAWKRLTSSSPKISLLVQDCDYGFRKITHLIKDNSVVQKFSDSEESENIIEIFKKDPSEAPEGALKRIFIDKLDAYEREHCIARRADSERVLESPIKDPFKEAWTIEPDQIYMKKIESETLEGDMPEPSCGEYGLPVDSRAYFEFNSKSPSHFLWVVVGQDTPLFDEQSIDY